MTTLKTKPRFYKVEMTVVDDNSNKYHLSEIGKTIIQSLDNDLKIHALKVEKIKDAK